MSHPVFVYGTLKQGFPNFHINHGERVGAEFLTAQAFPMYIVGTRRLPWLVNRPGQGHHVLGQLYLVDEAGLAASKGCRRSSCAIASQQRVSL